jgi:hypothetical protein
VVVHSGGTSPLDLVPDGVVAMIGGNGLVGFGGSLVGQKPSKPNQRRNCPRLRRGVAITARTSSKLGLPEGCSVVCPA